MQNLRRLVPQKMHQPDNRRNQEPWKSKLDLYWKLRAPMSSPSVPWQSWPHLVEWTRQYTNRGWGQRWRETWKLAGGMLLAPHHVPLKTAIPTVSGQTLTNHPTRKWTRSTRKSYTGNPYSSTSPKTKLANSSWNVWRRHFNTLQKTETTMRCQWRPQWYSPT